MFPSIANKLCSKITARSISRLPSTGNHLAKFSSTQFFSTEAATETANNDMLYSHVRVNNSGYKKFESPRKRANKIMMEVQEDAKKNAHNPKVHDVHFRVGDSIELTMISQGGVNSNETEKIRGVVLGIDKRGLGTGFYLRDVVFGEPVDRKIPLYSPLIKDIKVLEKNFVFKGKRKVKRAKLYYLRDRLPQETRVTKY